MTIRHYPVESSNLDTVGYDPDAKILEVRFKHGRLYRYLGVPADKFVGLLTAESVGSYLNQEIKSAHDFEKVA